PKLRVRRSSGHGGAGELVPGKGHPCGIVAASEVARRAGIPPMSPSWLRAFRPALRALAGWSARTPVGHGPAGSSGRQPDHEAGGRGMGTVAGPGGGAALEGVSVAPPPAFLPPAVITDSREHSEWSAEARLRALIATLPSPDREIVLLRVLAGVSIPDIVATLGVTPEAILLAQHQVLSALQPAATGTAPAPAIRQRVVLLPHVRTRLR
ncbi:MAG: sigma factor-like helix-turn-helix DNA-binding protein, partial [Pseudonocardiaceae bacterium]